MVSSNRITHNNPELRDVLLEFLDSASSLCDMTDTTMAAVPDEIMSIQADEACGAEYGARSDRRADGRNGYRSRRLDTTVGTLDLRIPKPGSGSYFPTDLPGRYSRTERALAAAVAETCAAGTPARKVEKVAAKFGAGSLSKDQVSRLCAAVDGEVDAFLARDWSAMRLDCLFPGATYAGCRVSGRVRSEALVTAIGVGDDGRRRLVGLACANAGGYASWRGLPRDLEGRGVRNVRLVTSDAHDGLVRAIREVYPEATWQRRVAHARRDVLAKVDGREAQRRARAVMSPILGESDPTLVRAPCHEAAGGLASFAPSASRVPGDAEVDALAYLSFPREHRAEARTNNARERTSCEPRRRAKGRPDVFVDGVRSAPARRHRGRGGRRLGIREPARVEGVPRARPGAREGREAHRGVRPERGGGGARRGRHDGGAWRIRQGVVGQGQSKVFSGGMPPEKSRTRHPGRHRHPSYTTKTDATDAAAECAFW